MSKPVLRPELKQGLRRLVIKIGSAALANPETGVDQVRIAQIVADCQQLLAAGIEVCLVSSGAIQIGRKYLKKPEVESMDYLQACSAIGQPLLKSCYAEAFRSHGRTSAQVLLTHEDIGNRRRSLNLKNMMKRLMNAGVTPILNENDSVSFAEITVGDNDQLAARVTEMIEADCLVILSTPDGLYPSDPGDGPAQAISHISYKDSFDNFSLVGKSAAGRGGMKTKLEAVRKLTALGIPVIIGTFKKEHPVLAALAGGGTYFEESPQPEKSGRTRWLLANARLGALVKVDRGAADALLRNSSLLPSGIIGVEGSFGRGDCIKIICGRETIGTGLAEYAAAEMRKISGCQSDEIAMILGYCSSKVAVHRDNLVLKERAKHGHKNTG